MRKHPFTRLLAGALLAGSLLAGAGSAARAADESPPAGAAPAAANETTPPLATRITGLRYQFSRAQREAYAAYAAAQGKPDDQRIKAYEEKLPKPIPFAQKAMAWAEQEPKDPAAINALLFVLEVTRSAQGPEGQSLQDKAIDMLTRDHLNDPQLAQSFGMFTWQHSEAADKLMQIAAEKSTNRDVRGTALFSEALALKNHSDGTGDEKQLDQARKLFEQVAADYGDVPNGSQRTLGDEAKTNLYEIANLAVGKTAPEIEGKNQDDKPMKLSDYRGKVVVLDFWGDW